MDGVHRKTALGEADRLLLAAQDAGTELFWDRYERQLPLCGFTSQGLSCRRCFEGPCRINPFGDEPRRGICGADADQIVMETLFQATLDGVLEAARTVHMLGGDQDFGDITPGLPPALVERLSRQGLLPVRKEQLFGVRNSYFSHKGYLGQTLRDLTRLGLINYGLLRQGDHRANRPVGMGAHQPDGCTILIAGRVPAALVQAIEQHAGQDPGAKVNVLADGASALPYVQAAMDHGSPELALGMGLDALVVAPDAGRPALETLAARYDVPVVLLDGGQPFRQIAAEAVGQARRHADRRSGRGVGPAGESRREALLAGETRLKAALEAGRIAGVAVVLGEPGAKQTFFARTLAVTEACLARRVLVILGGALGAHTDLLASDIAARRPEFAGFADDLKADGLTPLGAVGSMLDLPRVMALLARLGALAPAGAAKAVAVFPEIARTATWASAVSCLALGLPVQSGAALPFWGSPSLGPVLAEEWPRISGGRLLAGAVVPDAAAQAREIAALFESSQL
jgi:hypothetical protein